MIYFILTINYLVWFLLGSFLTAYFITKSDEKDLFYSKKFFSQKQKEAWEKVNNIPAESLNPLKKTSKKNTSLFTSKSSQPLEDTTKKKHISKTPNKDV